MARCPFAEWRPLSRHNTQPRLTHPDLAIVHTMGGGTLESTDAQFRVDGFTGLESHFGIGGAGELWQWGDTDYTADANADANDRAISIETADGGRAFPKWSGSDVPPWNDAQLATLVRLLTWICDEHSIPKAMVPDSRSDRRGIAGHRQGINSSPAGQPGYRKPGTETWSTKLGKVCPGDERFAQLKRYVVPLVAHPPTPKPVPTPTAKDSDMVTIYRVNDSAERWAVYSNGTRSWIPDLEVLAHLKLMMTKRWGLTDTTEYPCTREDLDAGFYGVVLAGSPVPPAPPAEG